MTRTRWFLAAVLVATTWIANISSGAVLYVGSRVTDTQIIAHDGWQGSADGLKLSWEIGFDGSMALPWRYSYTITNADGSPLAPEVSHIIFEVSRNIARSDLSIDFNAAGNDGPKTFTADPTSPNNTSPGGNGGNPNLPADLFGVKINGNFVVDDVISFSSTRAPMWGDMYVKDGKHGGIVATAWNAGIGTDPGVVDLPLGSAQIAAGNANNWAGFEDWIPVPDTSTVIPEPASAILLCVTGLMLLTTRQGLVRSSRQARSRR